MGIVQSMLIVISDSKEESALLFGLNAAELATVSISALALLVSLTALMHSLSARPKLLLTVTKHMEGEKYVGDVLMVYNCGRAGTVLTHVGIPLKGIALLSPVGKVGEAEVRVGTTFAPVTLGAGESRSFPFVLGLVPLADVNRVSKGFRVIHYAPRRLTRWKSYPMRAWAGFDDHAWKVYNPFVLSRSKTASVKHSTSMY